MSRWIPDVVTHPSQHQTEINVQHMMGAVCIESRWVEDPGTLVYSVYTRRRALRVAWVIFKAALTFRRFR